ncbi:MAG: YHS domain-containing protein, partial [Candidatus Deferrimicrobiota bacterium]
MPDTVQTTDPVCGMTVGPDSPHRLARAGTVYLFCCAACLDRFRGEPGRYGQPGGPAEPRDVAKERATGGERYTCPMHPEVRQAGPGGCPKCGMALEARTVSGEEE